MQRTEEQLGPLERHPYHNGIYVVPNPRIFIIGTFPIGKFTNPSRRSEILPGEIDFFYGGAKNLLWSTTGLAFGTELRSKDQIEEFLENKFISVADVIISCKRINGSANDKDLRDHVWNVALKNTLIQAGNPKLLFTSKGYAKKWFEKKIYPQYPGEIAVLTTSGRALIPLSRTEEYKKWLRKNLGKRPSDYIVALYKKAFGF